MAPITGLAQRAMAATGSTMGWPVAVCAGLASVPPRLPWPEPISFRSSPAVKARPAPVRISTRTAGLAAAASTASAMAVISALLSAFIACGRFSVSTA